MRLGETRRVSSREEETVFLDYLTDQSDGAHFFSPRGVVVGPHVVDVEHIRYESYRITRNRKRSNLTILGDL